MKSDLDLDSTPRDRKIFARKLRKLIGDAIRASASELALVTVVIDEGFPEEKALERHVSRDDAETVVKKFVSILEQFSDARRENKDDTGVRSFSFHVEPMEKN